MIWCRKTFGTKELAARHVFDCPRLSTAWYWCPHHKRPERFLECNKLCETVPKFRFRNRDYKLHLADKFINWIRRRRSEKRPGLSSASLPLKYMETDKPMRKKPNSRRNQTWMKTIVNLGKNLAQVLTVHNLTHLDRTQNHRRPNG